MQIVLAAETSSFFLSDDIYLGKIASCCFVRNLNRNKTARKIGIDTDFGLQVTWLR